MSLPTNGITADVFRDCMPPYHLSRDLVDATFAALPPPPPDAAPSWRQARVTRLLQEVLACRPADAEQARLATQMLILRERADALMTESYAAGVTVEQMCRLSRCSAELVRTAAVLSRTLARQQQKPVPFFGTVVADAVDVAAVDAAWGGGPEQREVGDEAEGAVPQRMAGDPRVTPEDVGPAMTNKGLGGAPVASVRPAVGGDPGWVTTRLEEGPGWSLDVMSPVRGETAEDAAAPTGRAR